jgi:hypothetical protein
MFVLSIGGYPIGYGVEVDDHDALTYTACGFNGESDIDVKLSVTPSLDAWARFWRSCKRIGVDKWREHYEPEGFVADGTNWEFDIQTPELTYKGEGDNAYPLGFKAFCSAVSRLLGGLEFF